MNSFVLPFRVSISGSDSRLRLWDVESCCNTLVNFDIVRLQTSKAMQLAVSLDSDLVFVPCMSTVKALSMLSGQTMLSFRSHYDNVNSCWYNEQDQELYTCRRSDRQILVWSPFKSNFEYELHEGMCKVLSTIYGKVFAIFPDLEAARPRSTPGIHALCSLHIALEKTKNVLQHWT